MLYGYKYNKNSIPPPFVASFFSFALRLNIVRLEIVTRSEDYIVQKD